MQIMRVMTETRRQIALRLSCKDKNERAKEIGAKSENTCEVFVQHCAFAISFYGHLCMTNVANNDDIIAIPTVSPLPHLAQEYDRGGGEQVKKDKSILNLRNWPTKKVNRKGKKLK